VNIADVKAKTELLLYRLLWLADKPMRPSFRNLEQSFEGWAYRNGLLAQIQRLEAQGFLESTRDPRTGEKLHRLTEAGRLVAAGGRDPAAAWAKKWDRRWRLFLFDIPEGERSKRKKLTRALSAAGCGCLQDSVWITPTAPPAIGKLLSEDDVDCSQLLMLLAESKGRSVDARMVDGAWNFEAINDHYREFLAVLDRFRLLARPCPRPAFEDWTEAERTAWKKALALDPLLPAELLPKGYLGRSAWRRRNQVLEEAATLAASLPASR
jgi:phenylacetic acid degradation operon negative regulatory protein